MLNFFKKLKEQPMPKFDHDSFYIVNPKSN